MGEFLLTPACCGEQRKSILQVSIIATRSFLVGREVLCSVLQIPCAFSGVLLKFTGAGV